MKKSDVQLSYHQGHRGVPMVNVKKHLWLPELIRQYKNEGHEHSGDVGFWNWVEELDGDYDNASLLSAEEWARESCWEDAQMVADECFPNYTVKVWSAGRSGGWLIVDGLYPVEEWNAIALGQWRKFQKAIEAIRDEGFPYDFIWNLRGEYEREVLEPLYAAQARHADAEAWIDALSVLAS